MYRTLRQRPYRVYKKAQFSMFIEGLQDQTNFQL